MSKIKQEVNKSEKHYKITLEATIDKDLIHKTQVFLHPKDSKFYNPASYYLLIKDDFKGYWRNIFDKGIDSNIGNVKLMVEGYLLERTGESSHKIVFLSDKKIFRIIFKEGYREPVIKEVSIVGKNIEENFYIDISGAIQRLDSILWECVELVDLYIPIRK